MAGIERLADVDAIRVETSVAGAEIVAALTTHGSWRELHPTDQVIMWLDPVDLVPLRVEVTPAESRERDLWAGRRGYVDEPGVPILIIDIDRTSGVSDWSASPARDAVGGGFERGATSLTGLVIDGYAPYRSGVWTTHDDREIEVASWSDGRSWIVVEAADDWERPSLFGVSSAPVVPFDLGDGSVGYLASDGATVAIHGSDVEIAISGTAPVDRLIDVARTIGVVGIAVPDVWPQAGAVAPADLPARALVPDTEGWRAMAVIDGDTVTITLTGASARAVTITERPGTRLSVPTGPDVAEISLRGGTGRVDFVAGRLEWLESGSTVVSITGTTVSVDELVEIAESMERR
jgi:hypothetical protein